MRKQVFGRQLKRDTNERKALFKGLASALVLHGRIQTTEEKAKAIKSLVDKLVTKAKKADRDHARQLLEGYLTGDAIKKMITEIAPRFAQRQGGYARILKVGRRFNDDASVVILEWVEKKAVAVKATEKKVSKKEKTETVASEVSREKAPKAKKAAAKKTAKPARKATRSVAGGKETK